MEDTKSVSETNREYWNSETNFYEKEKEWADRSAEQYTRELQKLREWLGLPEEKNGKLRLLDVACGPGMISHALFDFIDEARGVDIADRMVETYNKRAQEKGLPAAKMCAVQGNIVADDASSEQDLSKEEFFGFDLVGMSNALHHMESPSLALERLMQRLKPGGTLLIVDFITESNASTQSHPAEQPHAHHHGHEHQAQEGHGHGDAHGHGHGHGDAKKFGVAHYGFSADYLQQLLREAGCIDVETILMQEPIKFPPSFGSIERTSCFARGRKAA